MNDITKAICSLLPLFAVVPVTNAAPHPESVEGLHASILHDVSTGQVKQINYESDGITAKSYTVEDSGGTKTDIEIPSADRTSQLSQELEGFLKGKTVVDALWCIEQVGGPKYHKGIKKHVQAPSSNNE